MINIHNLAGRIANLYYDYDYYDFNDSLEVGETMEDAIFKIERVLFEKGGVDSYIDFMDEIIDNIEWEQTEDPSDPNYGEDILNRAMDIRDDLYSLKDGRKGAKIREGKASPNKSKESAKVRELIDIIEAPHGLAKINGYRLLPDKLDIINGGQFKITKVQYNRLKELGYGTDESYRRRVNEDTQKTIFKNDEYIIKQSPFSVRVLRYKTKILDGVPDTDYHLVLEVNEFGARDSLGRSYTLRDGDDPISFAKRWIGVKDIKR